MSAAELELCIPEYIDWDVSKAVSIPGALDCIRMPATMDAAAVLAALALSNRHLPQDAIQVRPTEYRLREVGYIQERTVITSSSRPWQQGYEQGRTGDARSGPYPMGSGAYWDWRAGSMVGHVEWLKSQTK